MTTTEITWIRQNGRDVTEIRNRRYIVNGNRLIVTSMDNDLIYEATCGTKGAAKSYAAEIANRGI